MFEKLDSCPVCHSNALANDRIIKDHSISQEDFALVRCKQCSFLFTNPRPTQKHLNRYYESEEYISHQNKSNSLINWIYSIARHFTLKWKRNIISKYSNKGRVLDIGCGTGHFITSLKRHGWSVKGVEPNPKANQIAINQLGSDAVVKSIEDLDPNIEYNIISMWHVLEHVDDLNKYLEKVKTLLAKNGSLLIAVPNHNSQDANHYKEYWAAYDVPRHFYHFTQETMALLAKNHRFKITHTIPMPLDAYYVSLLSEKYNKSGLLGYINSFINAYKSNSYARKNNADYSSLIFVLNQK